MKSIRLAIVMIAAAGLQAGLATPARAAVYRMDPGHASVSFKIRNFMSTAQGHFREFNGTVSYDPSRPETFASSGTIEVQSIDTRNADRDHHLLSKDFFDAGKFPEISFRADRLKPLSAGAAHVDGFLKIHGVERPVSLEVRRIAVERDKTGAERLKFEASARIDRRDFGILYSSAGPGNVLLGNDVTIDIRADAVSG